MSNLYNKKLYQIFDLCKVRNQRPNVYEQDVDDCGKERNEVIVRSHGRENASSSAVWIAETGLEKKGTDGLRKMDEEEKEKEQDS